MRTDALLACRGTPCKITFRTVVTLTWQAIWHEWQWYDFGNDMTPVKYISKYDGLVYDFDPLRADEKEFKLLLMNVNRDEDTYVKQRMREEYPSAYTFNINVTKELGNYMRMSFFANNMFRSYPSVRSKRTPSSYLTRKQNMFFGLELSITL